MNPPLPEDALGQATPDQILTALFAQMVTGHAQMAMMLLGKFPNPQSGQIESAQPEAAKLFIDQLEMLEAKTRGNLSADETRLLKNMLNATRLTFAEVIDAQLSDGAPAPSEAPAAVTESAQEADATAPEGSADDEGKVKFSKKY